jgi:hypothetical protein
MFMQFDTDILKTDTKLLEEKGIKKDSAEKLAQFKQAVDDAAYFQDTFGYFDKEEIPEDIYESVSRAASILEEICEDIYRIFETEESAAAVG